MAERSVCQRCGSVIEGSGCLLCGDTLLAHGVRDPLVGKVIAGKYQVIRKLGQGGMGAVYLAEQVGIGHRVALKFLNTLLVGRPDVAQRFLNEAKSYARIAHPHAVTFHEFGQEADGNLYISMEYIEGPDLKTLLEQRGRLPLAEAVEIVLQVADALEHAHANGVIHRDLKPENVIVRHGLRGPHAKVLDFGIAKLLGDGVAQLTLEGSIAGTPQYMPPEQVHGTAVDARADVYVLGVVLFELITGVQPFAAPTIPEMLVKQARDPVPPLAQAMPGLVIPAIDRVIQVATAKAREARHPSMAAFAAALVEATRTPEYVAAAASAGGDWAPGRAAAPGNTWVRGPGVQDRAARAVPVLPTMMPSGGTLADEEAPPLPPPSVALELEAERPPERRKRGSGRLLGGMAVIAAGAGAAWYLGLVPGFSLPAKAPAPVEAPVEAQPAPAVVQPKPVAAEAAPGNDKAKAEAIPAASDAKAEAKPARAEAPAPDDRQLRQRLLAREIWLKANAEFVAGNLAAASEILGTVPDDPEVRGKVQALEGAIAEVKSTLASARSLAARGDCQGAIERYDALLAKHPGFRDAASERARCVRMLPPSLAE